MNRKYTWLLLAVAAVVYALWSVNQQSSLPTSSSAGDSRSGHGDTGSAPAVAGLEQRVALLEQRLAELDSRPVSGADPATLDSLADLSARVDYLERDVAQQNAARDRATASSVSKRTRYSYPEESETYADSAESVRQAFDNDGMPEPALQVELENAQYLFDNEKISDLAFREVDCRANYCRLGYEDNSEDWSAAAITENELLLLLTEKYGDNITIHAGERNGNYRTLYIELPSQ